MSSTGLVIASGEAAQQSRASGVTLWIASLGSQ
jgi:hypothetical protein